MIDSSLLQVIKYREQYDKVGAYIPTEAIDKQTKAIVKDVGKYFDMHPDESCIDFGVFRTLFYTKWHKSLKDDQKDYFAMVLKNMEKDASPEIKRTLINNLLELDCATQIGNIVSEFDSDGEIDFIQEVSTVMESITQRTERNEGFTFASDDDCTIGEETTASGFKWPLDCMNEHYREIIPTDDYIVAASQGVGKTTFLANVLRQAAVDLPLSQDLVWLNNESSRGRIRARVIQAALQATNSELMAWKKDGSLNDRYIAVMGRIDRVKIYDVHDKDTGYMTDLLDQLDDIGVIVFDMMDNVRSLVKCDREDQRLEQLYSWARIRGVVYNCAIFKTSQVSREGDGELFPEKHMLKDSKVGKQGACDGIIMVGYANDPDHPNQYGISMPKTKSRKEGMGNLREVITANMDKAKYVG